MKSEFLDDVDSYHMVDIECEVGVQAQTQSEVHVEIGVKMRLRFKHKLKLRLKKILRLKQKVVSKVTHHYMEILHLRLKVLSMMLMFMQLLHLRQKLGLKMKELILIIL